MLQKIKQRTSIQTSRRPVRLCWLENAYTHPLSSVGDFETVKWVRVT